MEPRCGTGGESWNLERLCAVGQEARLALVLHRCEGRRTRGRAVRDAFGMRSDDRPQEKPSKRAFRVRDALADGIPRSRLTRRDLTAPVHGVRARAGIPVTTVEAIALVLRDDQFISHVDAARIWGAPVPSRFDGDPVHVSSIGTAPIMRRPQVTPHRTRVDGLQPAIARGLRVSPPARCWFECASLCTLVELVVLGDYFVGAAELASIDDLAAAIIPGGRAAGRARAALALVRGGVESPMETKFRLAVIDAGFPEPDVNVEVFDDRGAFLGRVDLAWPSLRIGLEYDGDHHRERSTFQHDQRRSNGFVVNDWILVHATSADAARPAVLFERLRQAFVQRRLESGRPSA